MEIILQKILDRCANHLYTGGNNEGFQMFAYSPAGLVKVSIARGTDAIRAAALADLRMVVNGMACRADNSNFDRTDRSIAQSEIDARRR